MLVGHVEQIWRYPVKSMGGEVVEAAELCQAGIPGDRCWAVIDAELSEIRSAKRWPELLNYRASLNATGKLAPATYDAAVPDVTIVCPDGTVIRGRGDNADELLAQNLGRQARLAPLASPDQREHYRLAAARTEQSMSSEMGLLPGEPMPDFASSMSAVLASLAEHVTPPGTYFDAFPLHLLSTQSLAYLSELGGVDAVVQRYRPNILIAPVDHTIRMTENDWVGHSLRIGEAVLDINSRTVRCSMPAREQHWCQLPAVPGMARAMVDHCERHLGVNVLVREAGKIRAGDEVYLISNSDNKTATDTGDSHG